MANALSSGLFFVRNADKVAHGQLDRVPVVAAQGASLLGKSEKTVEGIGSALASKTGIAVEEGVSNVAKFTKFASKAVNPLIVASGVIRVATSEDKEASLYKEAAGIGLMFAAEKAVKSKPVQDGLGKILSKVTAKLPGKVGKIIAGITKAAVLVGASIAAYDAGSKIGTSVIDTKRENEAKFSTTA